MSPPTEHIPVKHGMNDAVGRLAEEMGLSPHFGKGETVRLLLHAAKEIGIRPDPAYRPDWIHYGPKSEGKEYQVRLNVRLPPGDGSAGLDGLGKGSVLSQVLARTPVPVIPSEGTFSWWWIPYPDSMVEALRVSAIRKGLSPGPVVVDLWARAVRDIRKTWLQEPLSYSKDQPIRVTPALAHEYAELRNVTRRVGLNIKTVVAARMLELQGEM